MGEELQNYKSWSLYRAVCIATPPLLKRKGDRDKGEKVQRERETEFERD